jgi:hypothetical protein
MSDNTVTRRQFIQRVAILGAAVGVAPILAACGKDADDAAKPAVGAATGPLDCSDVSKLTDAEKKTRTDLQYVEASVKPDQNCTNCQQHTAGADANTCGTCTLVPGPINPNGWCSTWVLKVS